MKKKEFSKLALLGMIGGVMSMGGIEAAEGNSLDVQQLIAKPGCGAHGCGSVAEREVPKAGEADQDMDTDEDADEDASEANEVEKTPAAAPAANQKPADLKINVETHPAK